VSGPKEALRSPIRTGSHAAHRRSLCAVESEVFSGLNGRCWHFYDQGVADTSSSEGQLLWRLHNASGDALTCESHRSDHGVHLRFQSSTELLRETSALDAAGVESWARVWRAYYLTSGWSAPSATRRSRRSRSQRPSVPPARLGSILRYWTLTDRDGAIVACELVRTESGLEVRHDGRPKRAQLVHSMNEGLRLAEAWKSAVLVQTTDGWTVQS
jgi:hypothetical protein